MEAFTFGAIIGALITGCVIGAIPAIVGAVKENLKLGVIGFISCVVSALILGMLLAIPVCAIFVFLIFKQSKKEEE